ncbi:hypothetical protein ACFW5V_32425 [Streptomyces sp. NPDC058762]|uniref:hypothetical protein n=1 Tax=Streptomyces sp. NPDC058762 TaxID=3346629 RepID=UPI0036A32E9F
MSTTTATFEPTTIARGAALLLEPSLRQHGWTSNDATVTSPDGRTYEISADDDGRLTIGYDPAAHAPLTLPPIEPARPFVEPTPGNRLCVTGLTPDHGIAEHAAYAAHAIRVLLGRL